jgi:DNA-binding NtrC family response regulator
MYRLMLVDDEQATLNALKRTINSRENMEVRYYSDPEEALLELSSFRPYMVISDYRMRPIDGLALLTRVAEVMPDSVRILFTAYADRDVVVRAVNDAGVSRIVLKPWENRELLNIIREARCRQQLRLSDRRIASKHTAEAILDINKILTPEERLALWELEQHEPGITQVAMDEHGCIILSDQDAGDLDADEWSA